MELTPARKRRIKEIVGKCEICGRTDFLEIHHIDGNKENNVESNILVVCKEHHTLGRGAQYGHYTKAKKREIVSKRPIRIRKEIRSVIRDAKKRQKASKKKETKRNKSTKSRTNKSRKRREASPFDSTMRAIQKVDRNTRKAFGRR